MEDKIDLQVGDRVTYKSTDNEERQVIMTNLKQIDNYKNSGLIVKIERSKYEVVEEKKELLTEEEKIFLRQYIKIIKSLNNGTVDRIRRKEEDIYIVLKNGLTYKIEIGMQFGNMNINNEYTLRELGLD